MMSTEAFWSQVAAYNEATWLVAIAMIVSGAFMTWRVFLRPGAKTDRWMKVLLCFAFAWNGVIFFLIYQENPLSRFVGAPLSLLVSLFFALDIRSQKTQFQRPRATRKRVATLIGMAVVVLYPAIGWPLGHRYPGVLLPSFPCPLTVFAIVLVAAAAPKADKKVFIALLPWALMGLPKCFGALDCYEDCILFAWGVSGLVALIRNWRGLGIEKPMGALARSHAGTRTAR